MIALPSGGAREPSTRPSMSSRWSLQGKGCLITGGSKGLGLACADEMLALGAEGVLITARGEGDLEKARAALEAQHGRGRVHVIPADVTVHEDRLRVLAAAERLWGRLDVLVNNAGTNMCAAANPTPLTLAPIHRPTPPSSLLSSLCCAPAAPEPMAARARHVRVARKSLNPLPPVPPSFCIPVFAAVSRPTKSPPRTTPPCSP
jgi:hypothetical protein